MQATQTLTKTVFIETAKDLEEKLLNLINSCTNKVLNADMNFREKKQCEFALHRMTTSHVQYQMILSRFMTDSNDTEEYVNETDKELSFYTTKIQVNGEMIARILFTC